MGSGTFLPSFAPTLLPSVTPPPVVQVAVFSQFIESWLMGIYRFPTIEIAGKMLNSPPTAAGLYQPSHISLDIQACNAFSPG